MHFALWSGPWQPLKQLIRLRWKSSKSETLVQPVTWRRLPWPGARADASPQEASHRHKTKLEGGKQPWDMRWERKLGKQQDLRAAGKAEGRGKEVEGETQERDRAAERRGRKHEQPQQGEKQHSLRSSRCIKTFPFSPKVHQLHPGLCARVLSPWGCVRSGDGMWRNWKLPTFPQFFGCTGAPAALQHLKDEVGGMRGCEELPAESKHGGPGHLQPPPLPPELRPGLQARLLPRRSWEHRLHLLSNGQVLPAPDLPTETHLLKGSKVRKNLVIKGIEVNWVIGTWEGLETISRAVVLADWRRAAKHWGSSEPSSAQPVFGPSSPGQE